MRGLRTDYGLEGGDPGEPSTPPNPLTSSDASPAPAPEALPASTTPATTPPDASNVHPPAESSATIAREVLAALVQQAMTPPGTAGIDPVPAVPEVPQSATPTPGHVDAQPTPLAPTLSATPTPADSLTTPLAPTPSATPTPADFHALAPAISPAPDSTPSPGNTSPSGIASSPPVLEARPLPKLPPSFAPTGSTPLVRALEARVAHAAQGAPGGLVLALGSSVDELRGAMAQLWSTTAARSIHVTVPAGSQPTEAAVHSLIETLIVRGPRGPHDPPGTTVRPGAAALVDPLIARAASFVLAPDETTSIGVYLTPEALDESPAVAARLLARRFLPAFSAQMPQVPPSLMAALLRARCGGPDDAPDFATVAGSLGPAGFLTALGMLAARAGVAVVLAFEGGLETPAATAHLALEVPIGPAFALIVPVERSVWEAQRVLLSDSERVRAEDLIVDGTVAVPAPPVVAPRPVAPPPLAGDGPAGTPPRPQTPRARAAARRKGEATPTPGSLAALMPGTPVAGLEAIGTPIPGTPTPGAPVPGSVQTAVPMATPGSADFQEQLRRAVAARLAKPDGKLSGTLAALDPAHAVAATAPAKAPAPPKWEVQRGPSTFQKVLLGVAPFIFLAALPILGRMEPEAVRSGNNVGRRPIIANGNGPKVDPPKVETIQGQGPKLSAPTPPKQDTAAPPPQKNRRGGGQPAPQPQQPAAQPATPAAPQLSRTETILRDLEQELQTTPPAGQGLALDRKLALLDHDEQAKALVKLLEHGTPGLDPLRLAEIERLGPLVDVPAVGERLAGLLQPASPRTERLAGLQAVARQPLAMSSELRATVTALAHGDADIAVETQAQSILLALGDTSVPNAPPPQPGVNPTDPNGAPPPPWPPADPYNIDPPRPR